MKALKMRSGSTTTINIELARKDRYSSNDLESLVVKGTPLPAQGSTRLRAGRDVRGGDEGHILCEIYHHADRPILLSDGAIAHTYRNSYRPIAVESSTLLQKFTRWSFDGSAALALARVLISL